MKFLPPAFICEIVLSREFLYPVLMNLGDLHCIHLQCKAAAFGEILSSQLYSSGLGTKGAPIHVVDILKCIITENNT